MYGQEYLLYYPRGGSVDPSGRIFIADTGTKVVQVYDSDLTHLNTITSEDVSEDEYGFTPQDVCVDPLGRLLVADAMNNRICVFDDNLDYITSFGEYGEDAGQFYAPLDVACSTQGRFYVIEAENPRIQVFDANFTHVDTIGGYGPNVSHTFETPAGVTVNSKGWVFVTDYQNDSVEVFSADHTYITSIVSGDEYSIYRPVDVHVDNEDKLYITIPEDQLIEVFYENLTHFTTIHPISEDVEYDPFWSLSGVFTDGDGRVYITIGGAHNLTVLNNDLTYRTSISGMSYDLENPSAIALDSLGRVYVVDTWNSMVKVFEPDGRLLDVIGTGEKGNGAGEFDIPAGIHVMEDGRIFVVEYHNSRVQVFDENRTFVTTIGTLGDGDYQFAAPTDVFIDVNGRMFIADSGNHRIQVFDEDRNYIATIGPGENEDEGIMSPRDVTLDKNGRIYIVDGSPHDRIQMFTWVSTNMSAPSLSRHLTYPTLPSVTINALAPDFASQRLFAATNGGLAVISLGNMSVDALDPTTEPAIPNNRVHFTGFDQITGKLFAAQRTWLSEVDLHTGISRELNASTTPRIPTGSILGISPSSIGGHMVPFGMDSSNIPYLILFEASDGKYTRISSLAPALLGDGSQWSISSGVGFDAKVGKVLVGLNDVPLSKVAVSVVDLSPPPLATVSIDIGPDGSNDWVEMVPPGDSSLVSATKLADALTAFLSNVQGSPSVPGTTPFVTVPVAVSCNVSGPARLHNLKLSYTLASPDVTAPISSVIGTCTTPTCSVPLTFASAVPGRITIEEVTLEGVCTP